MTTENKPHILTSADSCIDSNKRFDIYHGNWKSITMNRRYTWTSLTHTTHTPITQYTHLHTSYSGVGVYKIATLYAMPTCQRQYAAYECMFWHRLLKGAKRVPRLLFMNQLNVCLRY